MARPVGLGGSGAFLVSAGLLSFDDRRFRENVARSAGRRCVARHALDELACHDLFDRARRAFHFDARDRVLSSAVTSWLVVPSSSATL
jgi:hypothetical protein